MPETKAHLRRRMLLFESIERAFSSIACIGSSQFIYFDAVDPRKCLAPDVEELVRFDTEDPERPLRVWDRVEGDLPERELETSRSADCGPLGAFWVTIEDRGSGLTLRLARDATGRDLFPTAEEARAQAELERRALEAERNALNARIEELEKRARDR